MLKELVLEYEDGRKETKIVLSNETTIYPKRDGITFGFCRSFKYKVEKHVYLPVAIARLSNKTIIMPAGIECHPETTLDDIIVIDNTPKIEVVDVQLKPKQPELRSWSFESSSGGGTYFVKETKNGFLRCDCPGVWRAKDRKCKHMKEVEKELGLVK
jgi:hypothetical protein